jgi:hypothetical protein
VLTKASRSISSPRWPLADGLLGQPGPSTDKSAAVCPRQFSPGFATSSRSWVGGVAQKQVPPQPVTQAAEDRFGLIFAAKTTASGLIALLVAFTFNLDEPYWPRFPSCRLLKADNAPFQSDGQGSERSNESRGLTEPRPDACAPRFGSVRRLSVDHGTHLSGRVAVVHRSRSSCRERRRPWPQALDPTQNLGEQGARYRHLR